MMRIAGMVVAAAVVLMLGVVPAFATGNGPVQNQGQSQGQSQSQNQGQSQGQSQTSTNTNSNTNRNTNSNTAVGVGIGTGVGVGSGTGGDSNVSVDTGSDVRQAPPAYAPGLVAAPETCMGAVSGGVSSPFGGVSFGSTYKSDDCELRMFARSLYALGYRDAALLLLAQNAKVRKALEDSGTVLPGKPAASAPALIGAAPVTNTIPSQDTTTTSRSTFSSETVQSQ